MAKLTSPSQEVEDQGVSSARTPEGDCGDGLEASRAPASEVQALLVATGGVEDNKKACPPALPQWGATPGDVSSNNSALAKLTSCSQVDCGYGLETRWAPASEV